MSTLALSGWSARGLPCDGVSRGRARCPPPRPPISGCDRGAGCTGRRRGRRTTSGREAAGGSRRWTLLLPGAAWPSTLGEKLVSKISELNLPSPQSHNKSPIITSGRQWRRSCKGSRSLSPCRTWGSGRRSGWGSHREEQGRPGWRRWRWRLAWLLTSSSWRPIVGNPCWSPWLAYCGNGCVKMSFV